MSETNHRSNEEDRLSPALHELAHSSPRSASAETKARLECAFHHHHLRRRRIRFVAMAAVIVTVVGGALGLHFLERATPTAIQIEKSAPSLTKARAQESESTPRPIPTANPPEQVLRPSATHQEVEQSFIALPLFAFAARGEDLRVVRVEMPLSALRLLGARINDEFITKDVIADLLVGADGTPYAFRLIA